MKKISPEPDITSEKDTIEELEEIIESSEEELLPHGREYYWSLFADRIESIDTNITDNAHFASWTDTHKNSSIPICLCDLDLAVIWTNKAFLKTFNYLGDPLKGCLPEMFKFWNKDHSTWQIKSILESPEKSYSWSGQLYHINDDSETDTFIKVLIQPLFFKDGIPSLYSCTWDIITKEFKALLQNTFLSLLEASKLKDNDTGHHIERVNQYSEALSIHLAQKPDFPEITDFFIEDIGMLAAMHDVGKIGTPDDILNKEGPLETWERTIMNEHTKNGAYILSTYPNPMARDIALCHHEKWDGSGYPYGIFEEMIPLAARIVAIADVYDALRSQRSYKRDFSHEEARKIIIDGKKKHFDPRLVDAFLEIEETFNRIFSNSQ